VERQRVGHLLHQHSKNAFSSRYCTIITLHSIISFTFTFTTPKKLALSSTMSTPFFFHRGHLVCLLVSFLLSFLLVFYIVSIAIDKDQCCRLGTCASLLYILIDVHMRICMDLTVVIENLLPCLDVSSFDNCVVNCSF